MNPLTFIEPALAAKLVLTLAHTLWQGVAVGLVAALICLCLRRRAANARYAVWLAALAAMALCPAATWVYLGEDAAPAAAWVLSDLSDASDWSDRSDRPDRPEAAAVPLVPAHETEPPAAAASAPAVVAPKPAAAPPRPPLEAARPGVDWQRWAPYAAMAYALGVCLFLARLMLGLLGAKRLRRRSEPVTDSHLLETVARHAKALRMRVAPAIAFAERVAVPTVVGVVRPMVLLPAAFAAGLTPEQVEMVLLHELAHVRRHDALINLMQRLVESVLFYHPVVWYVSRQIRIEREHCCDDLVLATGGDPATYARSLVHLAEAAAPLPSRAVAALSAAGKPSELRLRIERMLHRPGHLPLRVPRAGLVLTLLVIGAAAAVMISGGEAAVDAQEPAAPSVPGPAAPPVTPPALPDVQLPPSPAPAPAEPVLPAPGSTLEIVLLAEPEEDVFRVGDLDVEADAVAETAARELDRLKPERVLLRADRMVPLRVLTELEHVVKSRGVDAEFRLEGLASESGEPTLGDALESAAGHENFLLHLVDGMMGLLGSQSSPLFAPKLPEWTPVQPNAAPSISPSNQMPPSLPVPPTPKLPEWAPVQPNAASSISPANQMPPPLPVPPKPKLPEWAPVQPDAASSASAPRNVPGPLPDPSSPPPPPTAEETDPGASGKTESLHILLLGEPRDGVWAVAGGKKVEIADQVPAVVAQEFAGRRAGEALIFVESTVPHERVRAVLEKLEGRGQLSVTNATEQVIERMLAEATASIEPDELYQQAQTVVEQTRDEDWWLRKVAVVKLGEIGQLAKDAPWVPEVVDVLIRMLKDEEPQVQAAAADALGSIGSPRAVKHLAAALKSEDSEVRRAAAEALAKMRSPEVMDYLRLGIADDFVLMKRGAALALAKIGTPEAVDLIVEGAGESLHEFGGELGQAPADVVLPRLAEAARHYNDSVAVSAIRLIAQIAGDLRNHPVDLREYLGGALQDSRPAVRLAVLEAAASQPDEYSFMALVKSLEDESEEVRNSAAKLLLTQSFQDYRADWLKRLSAEDVARIFANPEKPLTSELRGELLLRLVEQRPDDAGALLAPLASSPVDDVRRLAFQFPQVESPPLTEAAVEALDHSDYWTRHTAATYLGQRGYWPEEPEMQAKLLVLQGNYDVAGNMGPVAVAPLLEAMGNAPERGGIVIAAVDALGRIGDARAVPALSEALKQPSAGSNATQSVIRALMAVGDSAAAPALVHVLRTGAPEARALAAEALGVTGGEGAVEALTAALRDADQRTRGNAAEALGRLKAEEAPSELLELMRDPQVMQSAAEALTVIGDKSVVPSLIEIAQDSQYAGSTRYLSYLTAWAIDQSQGLPRVQSPRPGVFAVPGNWEELMRGWLAERDAAKETTGSGEDTP